MIKRAHKRGFRPVFDWRRAEGGILSFDALAHIAAHRARRRLEGVTFRCVSGLAVDDETLRACSRLFSNHYGRWSPKSPLRPGEPVRMSPEQLRVLLNFPDSHAALAYKKGELVGHAFYIRRKIPRFGYLTWVTQLVVHEKHRRMRIGTRLLDSIWGFSDDRAWGLVTANPFTVRALEAATRRRCSPEVVARHLPVLEEVLRSNDFLAKAHFHVSEKGAAVDTGFYLDHTGMEGHLAKVAGHPWKLGGLEPGWEWLAFTFREQEKRDLAGAELHSLLLHSEQMLRQAYGRMDVEHHGWAHATGREVDFIIEELELGDDSRVVDFGCGNGRHLIPLASRVKEGVGIDYSKPLIEAAKERAGCRGARNIGLVLDDARSVWLEETFDAALCLYSVVGASPSARDNRSILRNLARHLKSGGLALISVMNRELIHRVARQRGDPYKDPRLLDRLRPSNTMQRTGDVFDPRHILYDEGRGVVYRKEQFLEDGLLSAELVVRDRRYSKDEIESACRKAGLAPLWSRYVSAGRWRTSLSAADVKAKEILVLARRL